MMMMDAMEGGEAMMMEDGGDDFADASGRDMQMIKHQENSHFTLNRMCFMAFNFVILLTNNMVFKNKDTTQTQKHICVVLFTLAMMYMTSISVSRVKRIHEIKE